MKISSQSALKRLHSSFKNNFNQEDLHFRRKDLVAGDASLLQVNILSQISLLFL